MATYTVTTLVDELDSAATVETPGGTGLSLREALALANNAAGEDSIVFADDLEGVVQLNNADGSLRISENISIYGDDRITLSGDVSGDDEVVVGVTDLSATASTELDDNIQIISISSGLSNVLLDGLTLTGGKSNAYGGAIDAYNSGLTVRGSTLAGNVSYGRFGGGAIYSAGALTIEGTTFFGNFASDGSDAGGHGGGAIFSNSGNLSVTNSTFVGNQAKDSTAASGGAIFAKSDINSTGIFLNQVTMTANQAENSGGGLFVQGGAPFVEINNSIILGNNASTSSEGNELAGSDPAFAIENTIQAGDATAIFSETATVNGRVAGVLADNGGPVQTVALNSDAANPALDAATISGTDARGEDRGVDLAGVDNGEASDLGAFELQISEDDTPPIITSNPTIMVGEGLSAALSGTPVTATDLTGVTFSIAGGPDAGNVAIDAVTGVLSFTSEPDFENPGDANEDKTFEVNVLATDENGEETVATLTLTITNVNEAPVASAASASGVEGAAISGALAATDVDGDGLTFSLGSDPANGDVVVNTDGSFEFTPDEGFTGTDSFTFSVSDGELADTGTATITVTEQQSLVVTTADDVVNALDGETSLREAVVFANEKAGADEITFADTVTDQTIRLTMGELSVTDALTVDGGEVVEISGDAADNSGFLFGSGLAYFTDNSRIFLTSADLTVRGLEISEGVTTGDDQDGGAIRATGSASLVIENSTFMRNGTFGDNSNGGAIDSANGDVTITNSNIYSNETFGGNSSGGAIFGGNGTLTISGSSFSSQDINGDFGNGGAVFHRSGAVVITDSLFSSNDVLGRFGDGGALYVTNASLDVSNSRFISNEATGQDGVGGAIRTGGMATITASSLRNNDAADDGGAIFSTNDLIVINSTISGNDARDDGGQGGGIFGEGAITLQNTTISGNTTEGLNGNGGAIYAAGAITVSNSIVLGNKAEQSDNDEISAAGLITFTGQNLVGVGAAGFDIDANAAAGTSGFVQNADPVLVFAETTDFDGFVKGSAGDNKGPTETIALNSDPLNPALDASGEGATLIDARGVASDGVRDLGSYELIQTIPIVTVTTLLDVVDAEGGLVSLRDAVEMTRGAIGPSIIDFDDDLSGVLSLTRGAVITDSKLIIDGGGVITITGDKDGNDRLTVDGHTDIDASSVEGDNRLSDNSQIFLANEDLTLTGLTLTGGVAPEGVIDGGGAVNSLGEVTIIDSTLAGNTSPGPGGGVYARSGLSVTGSVISDNSTTGNGSKGGGAYLFLGEATILDTVITGNSTVGAGASGGGLYTAGMLTITGGEISGNSVTGDDAQGGGVANFISPGVEISGTIISNNTTGGLNGYGGGVVSTGDITLDGVTLSNNRTTGDNGDGGGVITPRSLQIINSTVSGNITMGDGSAGVGAVSTGGLTAINSTFVDNKGYGADVRGGGIHSVGDLTLTHVTVTGNGADNSGNFGGGVFHQAAATITNSIITGNQASAGNDLAGLGGIAMPEQVNFAGNNIVGATASDYDASVSENVMNGNPSLIFANGLTNDGGDVQTLSLKADATNPALDATTSEGTDARGEARGVDLTGVANGGTSDLGAVELQTQFLFAPVITSGAALTAAENQTVAGAVMASDDKAGVAFAITGGADQALFLINATTGALSFKTAPDFEVPGDAGANNVFDVQVTVTDSDGLTTSQSLAVTVANVNEAPVAVASGATGEEDTVISGALTASDIDGDGLTFSLVSGPVNGGVTVNANGSFQFTPVADFSGTDSFTFRASDGALSDTATATITVNPADEPVTPVGPTSGDDTLIGTALNDNINALAGDDRVLGLAGDDLLLGGGGNDNILGAAGDDRLRGNRGDDTLKGGGGDDNIKGNGGADVIRGNGGNDVIKAGGGDDNVKGGGGDDVINGGGGADKLNGGGGADTLKGNGGDDTLKGNGGADIFQFRTSDRNDTIADFRQGQDKIEIQNGVRSFEGLDIEQDGRDVLIGFGTGQIRVVTDNAGAFDESDFIF